jgi:hypothetical protein
MIRNDVVRTYLGKEWPTLSANPSNDLRDMANILHRYRTGLTGQIWPTF